MKISDYFTDEEMKCKGQNCCGNSCPVSQEFMYMLDVLRRHLGGPLQVSSGFRCKTHNARIPNSAKYSKHTLGIAADVYSDIVDVDYIAEVAEDLGFYVIKYESWVHVDGRFFK